MTDYELPEVPYCDKELRRLKISVRVRDDSLNSGRAVVFIHFSGDTQFHYVRLTIPELFFGTTFDDLKEQIAAEVLRLAKWMVMTGQYKEHAPTTGGEYLELHAYRTGKNTEDAGIRYSLEGNRFRILKPDMGPLMVQEHMLARKILLWLLYSREALSEFDMHDLSHFPSDVIDSEWTGLCDSPLLTQKEYKIEGAPVKGRTLSLEGRQYFETTMQTTSGIVFIIAACESEDKPRQKEVIDIYKEAIRTPAGLEPIFQEHEEPHKNIYVDIFNYIDACEFVIADITYERPSCYIEIGYALAKPKQVLLFVEEDYFNDVMHGKVPFDLFATKYQTYKRTDLADLKNKCQERIKTVHSRLLS